MFKPLTKDQKKQVRAAFADVVDSVTIKSDGTIIVKRGFFYRHGFDAEKLAAIIRKQFPQANILECREYWNAWPRDSYWRAEFAITPLETHQPEPPDDFQAQEQDAAIY